MGTRRGFLKVTLGGAAILAAAGAVPLALRRTRLREGAAGRKLQFFTPAGEYVGEFGGLRLPQSIRKGPEGEWVIAEDDVDAMIAEHLQRRGDVAGLQRFQADFLQRHGRALADSGIVIDHEHR